jgi:hypothetical protein
MMALAALQMTTASYLPELHGERTKVWTTVSVYFSAGLEAPQARCGNGAAIKDVGIGRIPWPVPALGQAGAISANLSSRRS